MRWHLRWVLYALLAVFVLLVMITLVVQIPSVQNRVVTDLSARLSRNLGTEVKVGHVRFNFFKDFLIEDLLIRDEAEDTLLYSSRTYLSVDRPVVGFFRKQMRIKAVELENSRCYLKTRRDGVRNYDRILNYFRGEESAIIDSIGLDTAQNTLEWLFDPLQIDLDQVVFYHENDQRGRRTELEIPGGMVTVVRPSISDPARFESVQLDHPSFYLEKYPVADAADVAPAENQPVGETNETLFGEEFYVDELLVNDGNVRVVNKFKPVKYTPSDVVDWRDAQATNLDLHISDFKWEGVDGDFKLEKLSYRMPEGFILEEVKSDSVFISGSSIAFTDFLFRTPDSQLSHRIKFSFDRWADFDHFEDKVAINANLRGSYIALKDLLYFSPVLNENEFFITNGGEEFILDGRIRGTINNLRGRNLDLSLAGKGFFAGDLDLRNVTTRGEEFLKLELKESQIELSTLRQLIPGFNPPPNYDKLGNLQFTGKFEGLFHDFTASGAVETDLGNLMMDMRMNWDEGGFNNASYQGRLQLIEFDMARWADSEIYGSASLTAEVKEGKGLSLNEAYADLRATLDDFHYNGYDYKNAVLLGELNRRFFEGQFYIDDSNVTLDFDGHIDLTDTLPKFDFSASVEYIDFGALNVFNRKIEMSGDIDFDFTYHDLFNLDGDAYAHGLRIMDDTVVHELDSVRIVSDLNDGIQKNLQVVSDIFDFHLLGKFDLERLPSTVKLLIQKKHPQFAKKSGVDGYIADSLFVEQDFHFNGTLDDSRGIQKLFNAYLADFGQVTINGSFTADSNYSFKYRMDLHAPFVQYKENKFEAIAIDLSGEDERSEWIVFADKYIMGKKEFDPLVFNGTFTNDSLQFSLNSRSFANILTDIDLNGLLYLNDSLFQIDLANSSFYLLSEPWEIIPKNYIQLSDQFIKTENMVFLSDESFIRVSSPGDNSLDLELEKIDISFLEDLMNKHRMTIQGQAYSTLHIENIYDESPMTFDFKIDSLMVNGDDYGELVAKASIPDFVQNGRVEIIISNQRNELVASGEFYLPIRAQSTRSLEYDMDVLMSNYPVKILEYFFHGGLSNTTGDANGSFRLYTDNGEPSILGDLNLDGSTRINYLGTTYTVSDQKVKLNSQLFDLTDVTLVDKLGNEARFTGGITHNHFRDFGMNASISSDYFQFLDTEKEDNNVYYGDGIGKGRIDFSGDFQRATMRVEATTGPGSTLKIPVEDNYSSAGGSFITYVFERDSLQAKSVNLTGINLFMQLNITPDAEVQIIFDEFSGDVIKGTGSGTLSLTKERASDLQMVGRYEIDQGQYLYTLLDIINKPFVIDRGGLITWSGDPLNAQLNIEAKYTGLKVPPKNLIAEELLGPSSDELNTLANISTQVDLVLLLRGILSQPEIEFDILFPEIDPQLKSQVESKIRILKEDVSELNRQVYGLLFFNSFLPPNVYVDLASSTVNTLSEFLTSQLSNYVAAYITQGVEDVEYISGVDFYFDYNYYRSEDFLNGSSTGAVSGSEFALAPNIRFFDDRLAFSPGASVIEGTVFQGSAFIGTDVKLDFFITPDRRLKLSLFYKRFPSLQGSRSKLGVGFRFSKGFDSFGEIFKGNRQKIKTADP